MMEERAYGPHLCFIMSDFVIKPCYLFLHVINGVPQPRGLHNGGHSIPCRCVYLSSVLSVSQKLPACVLISHLNKYHSLHFSNYRVRDHRNYGPIMVLHLMCHNSQLDTLGQK